MLGYLFQVLLVLYKPRLFLYGSKRVLYIFPFLCSIMDFPLKGSALESLVCFQKQPSLHGLDNCFMEFFACPTVVLLSALTEKSHLVLESNVQFGIWGICRMEHKSVCHRLYVKKSHFSQQSLLSSLIM